MILATKCAGPIALALVLGLGQAGCNSRAPGVDDAAAASTPDTSAATPPITPPSPPPRDTPPAAANPGRSADQAAKTGGLKVSRLEYEGWRQYSVNCARCHGQDVLPNPVAANLLISLGRGGPIDTYEKFFQVVNEGRPARGMPAFKAIQTPDQIKAVHAYVKGRAEKRIPAGRPASPPA